MSVDEMDAAQTPGSAERTSEVLRRRHRRH